MRTMTLYVINVFFVAIILYSVSIALSLCFILYLSFLDKKEIRTCTCALERDHGHMNYG